MLTRKLYKITEETCFFLVVGKMYSVDTNLIQTKNNKKYILSLGRMYF